MNPNSKSRLFEIDCVKFFAIIYMIFIHVYEQLSVYDHVNSMPDSLFRIAIEFAGGPLAAPVFMFCMGIGMIYTRHNTPKDFCRRGVKLLITGYMLNFFRQTLPQLIGLCLGIDAGLDIVGGLLNVDILEFAGVTFLTVALMKKMRMQPYQMFLIAVMLLGIGIWVTRLNTAPMAVQCLAGLLLPAGKWVAFPLTLWLVYPAAGMLFAQVLSKVRDRNVFYRKAIAAASVFLAVYTGTLIFTGVDIRDFYALRGYIYYRQTILSALWIIPIVIIAISVCYLALRFLEQSRLGSFIRYCSINLNRIYIIQWLLVAYTVAGVTVAGDMKLSSPIEVVAAGLIIFAAAVGISRLLAKASAVKAIKGHGIHL